MHVGILATTGWAPEFYKCKRITQCPPTYLHPRAMAVEHCNKSSWAGTVVVEHCFPCDDTPIVGSPQSQAGRWQQAAGIQQLKLPDDNVGSDLYVMGRTIGLHHDAEAREMGIIDYTESHILPQTNLMCSSMRHLL